MSKTSTPKKDKLFYILLGVGAVAIILAALSIWIVVMKGWAE